MYNFSLSSSQKSLCRSSLRHGILCGDCRQKNGTLISLGRLDCYNCYSTLNSTIFATRPKRHRQLLHECFASKTSSWSLYCYRNILSTNINGNKREFSHKTDRALKCVMSGANGVERLNLAKNRRLSTDAESAIHILTFHRWWWWWWF